ncbi:MAG: transaldolase [Actinomycetota bacterium]|nr:transaldolase [Actinomycetota bacterium]
MTQNSRLADLTSQGVAVWLDDLSRDRINSGGLAALTQERSVVGVTTNPTIFGAAISGSDIYNDQVGDLSRRGIGIDEALRMITAYDVRAACDVLADTAARTGRDGRVSYEVDPRLAFDTDATFAEATSLWWLVDRPNLFIKIPATEAGLPAITDTIAEGISVNVTLIFSIERYKLVMDAYLSGLERRAQADDFSGFEGLESVASFFVSRVDTEIDKRLETAGADEDLRGKAGVANAVLAYQAYEEVIASDRWKALAAKGAHVQRPLWASTGTKNKAYPDTLYVSNLVAPDTVNTMPEATMQAYADHGEIGTPVQDQYESAAALMTGLTEAGVDLDDVFRTLEKEGVDKFTASWDELVTSVSDELKRVG